MESETTRTELSPAQAQEAWHARILGLMAARKEPIISFAVILAAWQVASFFVPTYLVPGVGVIFAAFIEIVASLTLLGDVFTTMGRIFLGLILAFISGTILGVFMGFTETVEKYTLPVLHFIMGIPALSWVVFAIIWFSHVETRIAFILLAGSLPNFALIIHDGIKSISKEYLDMLRALRPTRKQLFSKLILPGMIPAVLTAWKVNLGLAARVVIVAELVGATRGVGNKLLLAQELFEMPKAIAWTLVLVTFLLVTQLTILMLERKLLRWRPAKQGGMAT